MEKKTIPVILDGALVTDTVTGWKLAAGSAGEIGVAAVTLCAGGVTLNKEGAAGLCALMGLRAPVAEGAKGPLTGENGEAYPSSGRPKPELSAPEEAEAFEAGAVELMAKVVSESGEPVAIVSGGPLTNTAAFLLAHPELKPKIAVVSFAGGGLTHGNRTPAAEYNVFADPEAARVVLHSGVPLLMSGLDVTEKAVLLPEELQRLAASPDPAGKLLGERLLAGLPYYQELGQGGVPMEFSCALMALTRPELFTIREVFIEVETAGEYSRGATVADMGGTLGLEPNVRVVLDVDREGFAGCLLEALGLQTEPNKGKAEPEI